MNDYTVTKKRHWFVTVWFWLMIISAAWGMVFILIGPSWLGRDFYAMFGRFVPNWYLGVSALFNLVLLIGAIALLKWKKLGFWAICGITGCGIVLSLGVGLANTVGLTMQVGGLLILWGLLHIGGERKVWPQLD